ncbi:hypothetical protein CTAYLR_003209 [Chrysophaeum taylorii]|uniref:Polygalacturonase n=1 Tax=Chrysophaeum taylorii TaxID=2483200 RepID=A0AAD7UDU2_9STRA|nr:hypothetical protein CTAYLR_003209 [Chrysophaeum taylorii]
MGAVPAGPGPFGNRVVAQPVPGALEFAKPKVCRIHAIHNKTNATKALRRAISKCGDRRNGGVVLVENLILYTASLWLRSNLTLRLDRSTIVHTASGRGNRSASWNKNATDAPIVWTRRNSLMTWAHAGLLNGGKCVRFGEEECAEWSRVENVVVDGGEGVLDGRGQGWFESRQHDDNMRPMLLDLMWVRGLTIREVMITGSAYWTVHPTFCDNVLIENSKIITKGHNTDGVDPDSCWNVRIAHNVFDNGDDCIAIKSGRDWSGRGVNISTRNVLVEQNVFMRGHGVSIGSETAGGILDVTVRDSVLLGTERGVRLKSARGRGGIVRNILYQNLTGTVKEAISVSLAYAAGDPTNATATPEIHDVVVENVHFAVTHKRFLLCVGLVDSPVTNLTMRNVTGTQAGKPLSSACDHCHGSASSVFPTPCHLR